jgi:hypothetical protein
LASALSIPATAMLLRIAARALDQARGHAFAVFEQRLQEGYARAVIR